MVMIRKNERALLYLIRHFNKIRKMELVKRTFLISQANRIYDYIPYKYGPFSYQLYHDLNHLEKNGIIEIENDYVKIKSKEFPEPEFNIRRALNYHISLFGDQDGESIRKYVYDNYPFYTIFSKIEKKESYIRDETGILTIGYEGRSVDDFILNLIKNKVAILVDVRKNPFSMKYGFSKKQISKYTGEIGIEYLHIPSLGIEGSKRKNLQPEDYAVLFSEYKSGLKNKENELETLRKLGRNQKIALMCFENDPNFCHRGVIGKKLRSEGFFVENV